MPPVDNNSVADGCHCAGEVDAVLSENVCAQSHYKRVIMVITIVDNDDDNEHLSAARFESRMFTMLGAFVVYY